MNFSISVALLESLIEIQNTDYTQATLMSSILKSVPRFFIYYLSFSSHLK